MASNTVVKFKNGTPSSNDWKPWADRINAAWQKSVEGIIEAGRLLIESKEDLAHGSFESMVQLKLNFGPRTAHRLMAIAGNPVLSNRTHVSHLPPSWGSLYELSRADKELGEGTLAKWLSDGTITPKTERKDITALLTAEKPSKPNKPSPKKDSKPPEAAQAEPSTSAKDAFIEELRKLPKPEQVDELFDVFRALDLYLDKDFGVSSASISKARGNGR